MLVSVLILCVVLAAVCQPSEDRRIMAMIYAAPIAAYALWSDRLGDIAYYMAAAALSTLTAMFISSYGVMGDLQKQLAQLCAASVALNFAGWVIYSAGFSPWLYDAAFSVLYSVAIWRLIRGAGDAGDAENAGQRLGVYRHAAPRHQYRERVK